MKNHEFVITSLRQHEVSEDQKSIKIYLFTLLVLLMLILSSALLYSYSIWFSIVLTIPTAIFLCRFFVIQHDCGHNSFFTKRNTNKITGLILGFFTMVPSRTWNHIHDVHHGNLGNLEKRKINPELWTMTVNEYLNASIFKRIAYRVFRSKIMRLFITPILWMTVPRIPIPHLGVKIMTSVILHDLLYGVILYFIITNSALLAFTVVYLIPVYLFNFLASIMFYLQHQFEDTSWEHDEQWDLYTASIHGSSHLKTGRIIGWITGNVGCHHVHHLNTKIPSYELFEATEKVSPFVEVKIIYLNELFRHLNCVLWEEKSKKLIPFSKLKSLRDL